MGVPEDMNENAVCWLREGRRVAMATVINTWGSSPRPVGSQLLVDADRRFEGSVSGGCIEGEVITLALEVISSRKPKQLTFGVSNNQAWEVGLSCGGEIEIYIENINDNHRLLEKLVENQRSKIPVCLLKNLDSAELHLLEKEDIHSLMEFHPELEMLVKKAFKNNKNKAIECDGGRYFLQVFNPHPQIVIIGAVHIAQSLSQLGKIAGYQITIIDPREAYANPNRFPDVALKVGWPDDALIKTDLNSNTAIVVLSHDSKIDDPALLTALRSDVFYIGALGSRKTHATRLSRLEESGVSKNCLSRIHGPIGLDIGATNPTEIAIAIIAQIMKTRNLD
jgi:xanthine dehydrogenase accessory factor